MAYFVNELSLHNQYSAMNEFELALSSVLKMRHHAVAKSVPYYCSVDIRSKLIVDNLPLDRAISQLGNRALRTQVYRWFDEACWFNERQHPDNDLYSLNDYDVSGSSLAEAAYRIWLGHRDSVVSFRPSGYEAPHLEIFRHQDDNSVTPIVTANHCDITVFINDLEVEEQLQRTTEVTSWRALIEWSNRHCAHLKFAPYILDPLVAEPFYPLVARRVKELLTALNSLVGERNPDGSWTEKGNDIYQRYFVGYRPAFTDESETNKSQHKTALTFPHPERQGETLFCPIHGKINNPVFRIHFSWPIDQNGIYVVYLGQKLTKD